jgi:plasmid stabilization system protein ParE
MKLRYSARARFQIEAIHDFLFERNPSAARRVAAEIRASARSLVDFPHMGRKGEAAGTREWVVRRSPYLIVYEVDAENSEVWVLGVFHAAQDRREEPN